ncbi:MAG: DUF1800 family protein [Phycisphaerae bacterium]
MLPLVLAVGLGIGASSDPLASSKDWDEARAAHLLRRAGFGGTPEQAAFLAGLGRKEAVAYLVDFDRIEEALPPLRIAPYAPPDRGRLRDLNPEERRKVVARRRMIDRLQFERIVDWWLETMVSSPRPLQEKLVLFWHGHFTSGYREVRSSHAMYRQNALFRRRAAGNFRDLLLDITEDPAMVLYLNTQQNRRTHPNENYARELMELFTLGPGHYTEQDIKEAARAFTGIAVDAKLGKTVYRTRQHDFGEKVFLGQRGDFEPADIIDIILAQGAAAEFVAKKFWSFFAYSDPEPEIVQALARILREHDYELKPMLTAMFMSDAFYGKRARFTHIKSPVELVVGLLRELEIPARDTSALNAGLRQMGQQLMQPPNVKGWDGGPAWITTSTLFDRYNMLGAVLAGNDNAKSRRQREKRRARLLEALGEDARREVDGLPPLQPAYDPMPAVRAAGLKTPAQLVDFYVRRLLQRSIPPERRRTLIDAVKRHINTRNIGTSANADGIRGLIHLIVSMPEYQLS